MGFREQLESGEIVTTKSLLAFDEDILCRVCGHTFTLAEGNWEGAHPDFAGVKAIGIMCPNCERVNVAYYRTSTLAKLEKRIEKLSDEDKDPKAIDKAVRKYRREFIKVQKKYGNV